MAIPAIPKIISNGTALGTVERIGWLCVQGYPKRICGGCTSACCEPVFAYPES